MDDHVDGRNNDPPSGYTRLFQANGSAPSHWKNLISSFNFLESEALKHLVKSLVIGMYKATGRERERESKSEIQLHILLQYCMSVLHDWLAFS